jgi:outer membrane protein
MRRIWFAAVLIAPVAFGANESTTLKIHMGYVDLQKALQTVEVGRSAKANLEKQMQAKKSEIDKAQKDFQKEVEQFDKKSAILNDGAKAQKQAELQKKYVDLQKSAAEAQMDLQKKERDLTQPIIAELKSVVEGVGKEKQLQFVLEKNEGTVLYAESGTDLTSVVIDRFNAKNKGKKKD